MVDNITNKKMEMIVKTNKDNRVLSRRTGVINVKNNNDVSFVGVDGIVSKITLDTSKDYVYFKGENYLKVDYKDTTVIFKPETSVEGLIEDLLSKEEITVKIVTEDKIVKCDTTINVNDSTDLRVYDNYIEIEQNEQECVIDFTDIKGIEMEIENNIKRYTVDLTSDTYVDFVFGL